MKESILKRYPELSNDDVVLRDDGEGIFIDKWNSDMPKPIMEQVNVWVEEDVLLPKPLTEIEETKKQITDLAFELMIKGVL